MQKLLLLSTMLLGLVASCSSTGDTEHKAITTQQLEVYECGTITRLHTYEGLFLASQPKVEDFEQAKMGGVVTVINMRHESENTDFDEALVIHNLGLKYVNLPWNGPDELTDEIFDQAREMFNTVERPALVHCGSANRVGAVYLPWRVLDGGLSVEDALAEAKVVGLKTPMYETKALDYIKRHQM
jgi:protein tyrosine phosphatase (PTP) superfamily phosphohydrolase (DUF442 family)